MDPSAIRPAPVHPPDVPVALSTFVGRGRELRELALLLEGTRLLTITGAGGSGKTRLALELVGGRTEDREEPIREDVAWVELAPVEDPALVPAAVAEALGVGEERQDRPHDGPGLARLLGDRRLLLVLDNCEHVVDACAELVDGLLRACPGLRVLATSREALAVQGERSWLVPALSLPESDDLLHLERSEASNLFLTRARDVAPGFALTAENAGAVAEICRRLDGIPLALELAAARIRVLSPEQIRSRLDDAFRLLSSARRTSVPRHRTLRAAMDWSHDLLPEDARALLRRLSVFRGGATLDAAERVGCGPPVAPDGFLDTLTRLVDRSLVSVREHHGATRYTLLETVRQYAAERLEASGEGDAVRERHARHLLSLVLEAEPHFRRPERPHWIRRLQPDIDDIREALAWTRSHDPRAHVRLVGALCWFWYSTRHWTEAGRWTTEALALPEAAEAGRDRAALLFAAGSLASLQARPAQAGPWLEESADLARAAGDPCLEAYALNYLGMVHVQTGSPEGAELCRRAAAWFRTHDDLYGLRLSHLLLGTVALYGGDLETALEENEEGIRLARLFGQPRELGVSLQNAALVHLQGGDLDRAEHRVRESLEALRRDPSWYFIATSLEYLAEILGRRGRPMDAARLLGAGEAMRELIGAARFRFNEDRLAALLPALEAAAGADAWAGAWQEGRRLGPDEILDALPPAAGGTTDAPGEDHPGMDAPPARPLGAEEGPRDLEVRALGPFEVTVDGRPVPPDRWSWAKPREALVFLLLHPGGAARDVMGRALWPDAEPSRVKNSFHVTLHHLRKALGHPEWVVLEGDRYRIASGVRRWLDAAAFEQSVGDAMEDPDRLRATLALWRGELLDGEPAGPWIDEHRERLGRLLVEAWMSLGRVLEAAGRDAEAAELFRHVVVRDELREDAHRRLMAAWTRCGQRSRALRHYENLVALLRDELQAAPEGETVALYEELRGAGDLVPG